MELPAASVNARPGGANHGWAPFIHSVDLSEPQTIHQRAAMYAACYRALMETVPDAILLVDEYARIEAINPAAEELFGCTREQVVGRDVRKLLPTFNHAETVGTAAKARETAWDETTARHDDGSTFPVEVRGTEILAAGKRKSALVVHDLTERRVWQEQLLSAQRMETVGRLAGGIAHDFNNFLTVFSCNIDLMNEALRRQPVSDPALPAALDQLQKAWQGASGLTRQLLTFSRRQAIHPGLLDADQVVGDMERMLRPLLGEHIRFEVIRHPDVGRIRIDAGHIEQIIMNLALNARDAMPEGGTLRITTSRENRPARCETAAGTRPGADVCITVSDTGVGMDADVLDRAFEPFFTTKPAGRGTGLGLATVASIVRQAGGHIRVESARGRGATFRVYLPAAADSDTATVVPEPAAKSLGGQETILVCEDEAMILRLTTQILTTHGYRVLATRQPREALSLAAALEGPLHLLVTDAIMPQMNGPRLAEILSEEHPEMSVLFMSGYTSDVLDDYGLATDSLELLEKPFTPAGLLGRIRQILDHRDAAEDTPPPPRPVRVPPAPRPPTTCPARTDLPVCR